MHSIVVMRQHKDNTTQWRRYWIVSFWIDFFSVSGFWFRLSGAMKMAQWKTNGGISQCGRQFRYELLLHNFLRFESNNDIENMNDDWNALAMVVSTSASVTDNDNVDALSPEQGAWHEAAVRYTLTDATNKPKQKKKLLCKKWRKVALIPNSENNENGTNGDEGTTINDEGNRGGNNVGVAGDNGGLANDNIGNKSSGSGNDIGSNNTEDAVQPPKKSKKRKEKLTEEEKKANKRQREVNRFLQKQDDFEKIKKFNEELLQQQLSA